MSRNPDTKQLSLKDFTKQLLDDFRMACESREASLLGRKEVLTGKAKFGIFGDGKELPQIAMAKAFKPGDYKAGYYRDQTFMLATGEATVQQLFAQLYAHADRQADPFSVGRQMNAHFATPFIDDKGEWLDLRERTNIAADSSPTASQMARSLGLALASVKYKKIKELSEGTNFSSGGNEVAFVTIGDASTSEGVFWETVNAACVLKAPLAIVIWDDGYGISVPRKYQTAKNSISQALLGMQSENGDTGLDIYTTKAWDYAGMVDVFQQGVDKIRNTGTPALFHVEDVTQPQGHSTSGSHERYKSPERLQWEIDFDGISRMKKWLVSNAIASEEELSEIQTEAKKSVRVAQKAALKAMQDEFRVEMNEVIALFDQIAMESANGQAVHTVKKQLVQTRDFIRRDVFTAMNKVLHIVRSEQIEAKDRLRHWKETHTAFNKRRYSSHFFSESKHSVLEVPVVPAKFSESSPIKNGFEVLNACFDANLSRDLAVCAFGEDLGKIGDVNQGFAGLQEKHGIDRVFDTGIRENTIMGQGIGMAMRGLRPIAEIQYVDYLVYGLQPLTDDLATLQYRTAGLQKAPLIVRTRGHRLEGIWHTGSPMGMILSSLRGVCVLVPRNMTQAAGFYNTMLRSDDPALIIECLNGYRLKEKMPDNIGGFTVPVGQVEVLQQGYDISLVTYGSCVRVAQEAISRLAECGISVELIDVQSLLPFDLNHDILKSVKKTNRLLFLDEDVPGSASAFMMQKVMEEQGAWQWMDSPPQTLTASEHRSPYGSDGDYFSKPNAQDVFEAVYGIMNEADPAEYPIFY